MVKTCPSCADNLTEGAYCNACKEDICFDCAGITEGNYRKLGKQLAKWKCASCKGQQSQPAGGNTTVPNISSSDSVGQAILTEIKALSAKVKLLESLPQDLKSLRNEVIVLQDAVKIANNSIAEFADKVKKIEDRMTQLENAKRDQANAMQIRLDKIENDLNEREQWSRMSNIEIKGIKPSANENLFNVVIALGNHIQYPIQKAQINFVTRVPTRDPQFTKPIIVCFNSRYVKEDFIAAARSSMKTSPITPITLGLAGTEKIYVNDHLTPHFKTLLTKAKKIKEDKGFQYLWVKHCKIFFRKTDTSPIINIKSERDLIKLDT
ncbi:hypothetical protein NE865_06670 [Phthorimaea operculella]|nr:hypothetical protein NE865_06670 [Phthorimaea operculella]